MGTVVVLSCLAASLFIVFFSMISRKGDYGFPEKSSEEIDRNSLKNSIQALQSIGSRSSHAGQKAASRFIQESLRSFGLIPAVQQYVYAGTNWDNIILTFPGDLNRGSDIIIIAHYDSKSRGTQNLAPGADDNGSGAAVLLELARILQRKSHFSTVQLVFISNEENGHAGSKAYAHRARQEKKQIFAVLNIDGVGYTAAPKEIMRGSVVLFKSGLPFLKRGKMFVDLLSNFVAQPFRGHRTLKLVTQEKDRNLIEMYSARYGYGDQTAVLIKQES